MKESIVKLLKHSGIYGLSNVLSRSVTFFLLPVYLKYLTPSDYGILEISNTLLSLLIITELLSVDSGLFKLFYDKNVNLTQNDKVGSVLFFYIIYGIIVSLILLLCSDFISKFLYGDDGYKYIINLVVVTTFFQGLVRLYLSIYRMKEKPVIYGLYNVILTLLIALSSIFFVVKLRRNFTGIREATFISFFIIAIVLIITNFDVKLKYNKNALKKVLNLSIPLAGSGLASWIINLTDRYMLRVLLPQDIAFQEIGIYGLAAKYALIMHLLVVTPFMMAWSTLMFSYQYEPNARQIFSQVLNIFVIVSMAIFSIMSIFGKEVIALLAANTDYHIAYIVVPIITMSKLCLGLYMVFTVGVTLVEKTKFMMYSNIAGAIINVILNLLFIRQFSYYGASIASVISNFFRIIILYYFSQKYFKIPYNVHRNLLIIITVFSLAYYTNLEINQAFIKIIVAFFSLVIIAIITPVKMKKMRFLRV